MPLFLSLAFDWLCCPPPPPHSSFSVLLFLMTAILAVVTTCLGWATKTEMGFSGRRSIQMIVLASGERIDFTTVQYLNNKLPGASSPCSILALLEHNLGYHLIGPGDWWATFERIWWSLKYPVLLIKLSIENPPTYCWSRTMPRNIRFYAVMLLLLLQKGLAKRSHLSIDLPWQKQYVTSTCVCHIDNFCFPCFSTAFVYCFDFAHC